MFKLKKISQTGIAAALEKAKRYRLLNEPLEAESICLDILEIDPDNAEALVMLTLAYTDQLALNIPQAANKAREIVDRLGNDYDKRYFKGIICERQGKAALSQGGYGRNEVAYEWLREAMDHFEKAESLGEDGNDDAILRWNTCARIITTNKLKPKEADDFIPLLE